MLYVGALIATTVAAIVAPYVLPAPEAPAPVGDPKQDSSENLLKISLYLGIAVSAFTLVSYLRGK